MARRPDLGYFDEGIDLADPASYADTSGAFGEARAIAPLVYRSLAFAYLEDEAIWTRDWICVGREGDIPEAGDLLPFTVGNHGIHVQRRANGGLEGRFNNAQHGGCRFVPVQCQGGTKTKCSFTSCGYSRDRDVIPAGDEARSPAALHQYLGLRPERLLRVGVATLGGLLFVNLDPAARPPERAERVEAHLHRVLPPGAPNVARRWREFETNWKTMAEALVRLAGGEPEAFADAMLSGESGKVIEAIEALWLYPNAVVVSNRGAAALVVLQQTAVERTLCRVQVFGAAAAGAEALAAALASAGAAAERLHWARLAWPRDDGAPAFDRIAHWSQARLVGRIAAMPRPDHREPIFGAARHYSI